MTPHIPLVPLQIQFPAPGMETLLLAFFVLLGLLSLAYMVSDREPRLIVAALVHAGGGCLALTAGDMLVLLLGWETMTFAAFFIITQRRTPENLSAGLRYIVTHMASAVLFFTGAVYQWHATGSLLVAPADAGAQPFFLAAILIKCAALPVHFWLIDAYPRAPYSGSVLLSVYTTKVGVFTAARILRFTPFNIPVIAYLGAFMAVFAVVGALRQNRARSLLAYHMVSQIGYMLAGVGLAAMPAAGRAAIDAGLLHAVNNIVYKSLLFMVVGVICRQYGHDDLRRMGGGIRKTPFTFIVALTASAAIVGVPPFNGFVSKELLKQAIPFPLITALLTAASVGTGLSFIKFIHLVFRRHDGISGRQLRDPPAVRRVPMMILAALCPVMGLLSGRIIPAASTVYAGPGAVISGLTPVLAAGLAWLVLRGRLLASAPAPLRMTILARTKVRPALSRIAQSVRRRHELRPQTAFALLFVFWIAVTFWLRNLVR